MNKSTKNICIVSGILIWLAVLYFAGAVTLSRMGLEYRFWVDAAGKVLCILILPLWVIGIGIWKLRQRFREHIAGKWLIRLLGCAAAVVYLFWCWMGTFIILFGTNEDHYLGGGLVAVVTDSFPNPTSYSIYESVGPFFRKKASLTPEAMADYLEEKYHRGFYPVETDGEILYVDAEREDIKIKVEFISGKLQEDYPQALADYYLQEGCLALNLNRECDFIETGSYGKRFCLVFGEGEKSSAFSEDAYNLMQYALEQDSLLKKYDVFLYYSAVEYEGKWERMNFGKSKQWDKLSSKEYGDEPARVMQLIVWGLDNMRLRSFSERQEAQGNVQGDSHSQTIQNSSADYSAASQTPASEPALELTEREMAEGTYPEQCEAAEAIWEAELKDLGYDYEPGFNAKGNLIIRLGKLPADNLQSTTEESDYYLTYDRESKNGNCYLFVLSEVPEGNGLNDAYLREFYACEKETLQVAAGNKTSWEQVGCAEYRKLTGE